MLTLLVQLAGLAAVAVGLWLLAPPLVLLGIGVALLVVPEFRKRG